MCNQQTAINNGKRMEVFIAGHVFDNAIVVAGSTSGNRSRRSTGQNFSETLCRNKLCRAANVCYFS
jgi:hypothetical protein